jgi:type I restriction enzyme S subunit
MGLSPKGESYNFEQIGIPLLNGAADYNNGLIEPKKYTTDAQRCNEIGDLVFCIRATIGNLVFADEIYCLGRGVASFKSTIPNNQFIIFQILNNSFEMLKSQASGSVILGLTKDDINDIKLMFNEAEFLNYSSLVSDFFKLIKSNRYENKELISLRDTLLPKLITGELQINEN